MFETLNHAYYKTDDCIVYRGDCLEIMKILPDNFIDAVVTDPPYELGFMNKAWDKSGIAYNIDMWKEILRILKPGGHLLSFGGSRTYHRMACAIEDAGFEIRDMIEWMYGSGFPKSLNIGKAVDMLQGNEREGIKPTGRYKYSFIDNTGKFVNCRDSDKSKRKNVGLTKGNSEWEGWGTALKPSHEPICMARNPLSEKTIAENVLKWGTGGINVDGCRIETQDLIQCQSGHKGQPFLSREHKFTPREYQNQGRFPANLIHDGSNEVMGLFPQTKSGSGIKNPKTSNVYGGNSLLRSKTMGDGKYLDGDSGSAARFFYCAKASRSERNAGLNGILNNHPTVKPIKLMEYLVKLITPPNGIVLDMFMGSGSTGVACKNLNRKFIGIEISKDYIDLAIKRITNMEKVLI